MTNHERLTEQYEDALFALLMDSVAEEEGKQALELNERLKADPAAEVPESARRRCEATIRREFNRKILMTGTPNSRSKGKTKSLHEIRPPKRRNRTKIGPITME